MIAIAVCVVLPALRRLLIGEVEQERQYGIRLFLDVQSSTLHALERRSVGQGCLLCLTGC